MLMFATLVSVLSLAVLLTGAHLPTRAATETSRWLVRSILRPYALSGNNVHLTRTRVFLSDSETSALDSMMGKGSASGTFWNGFKTLFIADRHRGLVLVDRWCCAREEWTIAKFGFIPADVASLRYRAPAISVDGIRVGSSESSVLRRFGAAPLRKGQLSYEDPRPRVPKGSFCVTDYVFTIAHGTVEAMDVNNSC